MPSRGYSPTGTIVAALGMALLVAIGASVFGGRPNAVDSPLERDAANLADEHQRNREPSPREGAITSETVQSIEPPTPFPIEQRVAKPVKLEAAIEGSLLWHSSVDSETFRVALTRPNGTHERSVALLSNGAFRVFRTRGLPRVIDVVVTVRESGEVLARVAGVRVPAETPASDRRLTSIDVTRVQECVLSFLGADKTPLHVLGHAQLLDSAGKGIRHVHSGANGKLALLTTSRTLRAHVWAAGFIAEETTLDKSKPVQLRVGHHIDVRRVPELMPEGRGLPPPPRVWLRPVAGVWLDEFQEYRPDLQRWRDAERERLPLRELELDVVEELPHGARLDGSSWARSFYSITRPSEVEVVWSVGRTVNVVDKITIKDVHAPPRVIHVVIEEDALTAANDAWERSRRR